MIKCLLHNKICEFTYHSAYHQNGKFFKLYYCKYSISDVYEFGIEFDENSEITFYKLIDRFANLYLTSDKIYNITWHNSQKMNRFISIENYESLRNFI